MINLINLKKLLWIMVVCMQFACTPSAKDDETLIKKQVEKSFRAMMSAAFNLDIERYFAYIDKRDYIGIDDTGGIIHSNLALENLFRKNFQVIDFYESFNFNNLSIKILSSKFVLVVTEVTAKVRLKNDNNIILAGGYSQIWKKIDKDWRVISSSSTVRVMP